jgi:hypothetical protein
MKVFSQTPAGNYFSHPEHLAGSYWQNRSIVALIVEMATHFVVVAGWRE